MNKKLLDLELVKAAKMRKDKSSLYQALNT